MSYEMNKRIGDAIKEAIGCEDCRQRGRLFNFAPENLEFDHIDPSTKCEEVSKIYSDSRSKTLIEIAKCRVVCTTHHRIRHGHLAPGSDIPGPP